MFTEIDKDEIRHRALLEVVRFFGSVTDCAKALQVSRARVSNWLNKIRIRIPYEYVLLMEHLTQVSIERLSPFTEKTNKAIRSQQNKEKILEQSIEKIIKEQPIACGCCQQSHPILVGTDGVLIRCLSQLEAYKKMGKSKVPVIIIDVDSLLLGVRTIEEIPVQFSISDRVAIGLRLEQLIGNRQGQRTDLNKNAKIHENSSELRRNCDEVKKESLNSFHGSAVISEKVAVDIRLEQLIGAPQDERSNLIQEKPQKNVDDNSCNSQLRHNCDEVIKAGRTDVNVAAMVNFNSRDTYRRAKRVYLQGIPELIHAMDCKKISIAHATKIDQLSKAQQQVHLQSLLLSEKQDV